MHDGAKNAYSFKKDGVTFKIRSLLEEGKGKSPRPNVLLVSEKEFIQTLEDGDGLRYALVLKPKEEK